MADPESALLSAVLGFAQSRLNYLLTTLAPDAASLLLTVLPGATQADKVAIADPAVATAVLTSLDDARTHLADMAGALVPAPQSVSQVQPASDAMALTLGAVHSAMATMQPKLALPGIGTAERALVVALQRAIAGVGDNLSGLAAQLGLGGAVSSMSAGLDTDGPNRLTYQLANAAERAIGPAGVTLTLSGSSLKATVDYGAAPPILALSLGSTIGVGLIADGFVQMLLGAVGGGATASVTVGMALDTAGGLSFQAGTKHRIDLPGQLSIPGIDLRGMALEVPASGGLALEVTGTIAGALGPLKAVVQGAGVRLTVDPALLLGGRQPLTLSLRPPTGAGLSVDAGLVRGGGFVSCVDGTYGGALDLKLGPIEIKAVGLLTPDPFSLVLILSVRFTPAIQLSFGFTLNAVGGILALERTVATDVLRAKIHDHTSDALLFPDDPVATAPTIFSLLGAVFPPQAGGFVVGPLLELGWGAPVSFVTARLGVVIALPDPKVILLGSLRVALPLPEAPIVDMRAEVYGEITPDHILFLVSLSGSNIAGFVVSGDFGVLIGFGDAPDFAFSAGGFHPHYPPPGELAGMNRVGIDLSPPALLTMRAEAYLALTSNSFQLGCRVELRAEVAGVGAEGHLQFDALVRWAPRFSFEIDLSAGFSLLFAGETFASVDLHLHLEGPGPWLARGSASISLLFFDVNFELPTISWGSGDNPPAKPVSPQTLVADGLSLAGAWSARLPPDADNLVHLVDLGPDPAVVVVHPLGALETRQQAVPLETTIDRVGRNPVTVHRVNLGAPTVGGLAARAVSAATDLFAPGEFIDLTDDQKMSRPGFESCPSGAVIVGADTDQFATPSETSYEWDTVFPPQAVTNLARLTMSVTSMVSVHAALLDAGPAGKGFASGSNPYTGASDPVLFAPPGQVQVRSTRDLTAIAGVPAGPMTTAAAARIVAGLGSVGAQYVGAGVAP